MKKESKSNIPQGSSDFGTRDKEPKDRPDNSGQTPKWPYILFLLALAIFLFFLEYALGFLSGKPW